MTKNLFFLFVLTFLINEAYSQKNGILQGVVKDKNRQELLPGATVIVENSNPLIGSSTDIDGKYKLEIPVGSYNIKATLVGYKPLVKFNILITTGNINQLNFELEEENKSLGEVEIKAERSKAQATTLETVNSVQSLTVEEIKSNPGGNFDISRVIQALPGVAGSTGGAAFRNDIIIRGGAPNENVYYLDGIEIPVINHFATQGSAGGPAGILNVSFIEDISLKSSAFDARYDNALASVFQINQKDGNSERIQGNIRLSSTELAATLDGPLSKKTTFLASARRSYLQLLFAAIDLPIRPNYWDFQYKVTHKFNNKTTLTAIGVGAIDEFKFGVPRESTPEKTFVLNSNPFINQWNYTTGIALKRLTKNGFFNVALSRNMFDNKIDRFEERIETEDRRITKIRSQEIENKLRVDFNYFKKGWKINYGGVLQYVKTNNLVQNRILKELRDSVGNLIQPELRINFNTAIQFWRYGLFIQASKKVLKDRLSLTAGLRSDGNSFTTTGNDLSRTLSPRAGLSYSLTEKLNINASYGIYYKIPTYTILSFRDAQGEFVNRNADYTRSTHYVAGLEWLPTEARRITVEGFYKDYANYPVSLIDGISLANQGGGFAVLGNEPVRTDGIGRVYGAEAFFQQKLTRGLFLVFSYTFYKSEFSGADGKLVPSAWDYNHLFSAIVGKKFKRNWEIGLKYRYAGGAPYTPFDLVNSQKNFPTLGTGILDFNQLNTLRLRAFNQFDFRIDKKYNYKRATLDLYFDVQNALLTQNEGFPTFTFERTADNSDFKTTDGQPLRPDGSNGIPVLLQDLQNTVVPSIGFIFEF